MWETFRNVRAVRLWLSLIILFLVSVVQSCTELKYSIFGVESTARVMRIKPSEYESDDLYLTLMVEDENGATHRVKRTVKPRVGPVQVGDNVEVIYFRGAVDRARLVAERRYFWPIVMFSMLGVVVIWSLVTYRQMESK